MAKRKAKATPPNPETEVRNLLEQVIPITDELTWCFKAEQVLEAVLEGITMRIQELDNEDEEE